MEIFEGKVSGIDVTATPGQPARCLAFVSQGPSSEIQVTTGDPQLQSALETACSKNAKVEASFEQSGQEKKLTRVRLLDR